jgi:hypothetical protein
MADRLSRTRAFAIPQVAPEVRNFAALAVTAGAVIASGLGIAAVLPEAVSPWLSISAFAAPAGLAFLAYWWVDQTR